MYDAALNGVARRGGEKSALFSEIPFFWYNLKNCAGNTDDRKYRQFVCLKYPVL